MFIQGLADVALLIACNRPAHAIPHLQLCNGWDLTSALLAGHGFTAATLPHSRAAVVHLPHDSKQPSP
jgi:hypothetical protein